MFDSWWDIVQLILFSPVVFFLWCVIHEAAHLLAILPHKPTALQFRPYPHKHQGAWYWARISYRLSTENISKFGAVTIALAPRVTDLIACVLLIIGAYSWNVFVLVFLLGGAVDFFTGSLGISDNSDLAVVARVTNSNRWFVRGIHWVLLVTILTVLALRLR